MNESFKVTSSPHIKSGDRINRIMLDVIIALIPAGLFSIYYFGFKALLIMALCVGSCIGAEALWQVLTKQRVSIDDLSAVVTGLLLAYNLPVSVPWYIPVIGGIFAIIIVKQIFGGLGQNFMNPALAARAFLLISWAGPMTKFTVDGITSATPLSIISLGEGALPPINNLIFGTIGGSLGETSAILLLLGGLYLIFRRVISWRIPTIYIGTVLILTTLLGGQGHYEIFAGGLFLGAIFMATDYATSPMTAKGQIIFALGCGILTVVIRRFAGLPEGVSYAIILMNLVVPLIDRYTRPRAFGEVKA